MVQQLALIGLWLDLELFAHGLVDDIDAKVGSAQPVTQFGRQQPLDFLAASVQMLSSNGLIFNSVPPSANGTHR